MKHFSSSIKHYKNISLAEAESKLLIRIDKVTTLFDFHQTTGWVLPSERYFAGKKVGENEYIVSRYRHTLFTLTPRVITKIKLINTANGTEMKIKARLNVNSFIAFIFLSLLTLLPLVGAIIRFEIPQFDEGSVAVTTILLGFIFAAKYEATVTERMINDVLNGIELKSVFSA